MKVREEFFFLQKVKQSDQGANMTQKAYIMHELAGRGYSRFEEVPEEMLDYMPENLEGEEDHDVFDDGRESPWFVHVI